jgi:hypothetical protein
MLLSRRSLLTTTAAASVVPWHGSRAQAKPLIRIGVMNDISGRIGM